MCIICTKEYNNETKKIFCCPSVSKIPILPNLTKLNCYHTNITEIPILPKLEVLYCSNTKLTKIPNLPKLELLSCHFTKITKIPNLPNLTHLYCYNTNITEIPILPNLKKLYCQNCDWLERYKHPDGCLYKNKEFKKQLEKLILIQKLWKNIRWQRIKKFIPLISDIKENCIKVYL